MMKNKRKIIEILKKDGIGVIPSDTIYGLAGSAFSQKAVERIYQVKQRNLNKPLIILISSFDDLKSFGVEVDKNTKLFLQKIWPGKVSIILPFSNKKLKYLNKNGKNLAFRFSNDKDLIKILRRTGPLVAPSANPEGRKPAKNIQEAKKYFGDKVDFYLNDGNLESLPSTLVEIKNGKIKILRKGGVDIMNIGGKIKI